MSCVVVTSILLVVSVHKNLFWIFLISHHSAIQTQTKPLNGTCHHTALKVCCERVALSCNQLKYGRPTGKGRSVKVNSVIQFLHQKDVAPIEIYHQLVEMHGAHVVSWNQV